MLISWWRRSSVVHLQRHGAILQSFAGLGAPRLAMRFKAATPVVGLSQEEMDAAKEVGGITAQSDNGIAHEARTPDPAPDAARRRAARGSTS
jgi:hypothetical protein